MTKNYKVIKHIANDNTSENGGLKLNNAKKSLSLKKCVEKKVKAGQKRATKPTKMFKIGEEMVDELLELQDGLLAMTCVKEHVIRIFDYIGGRLKKELFGHNDFIIGMMANPAINQLVTYSCDKDIKIWSIRHNFMLLKTIIRDGMINDMFMISPTIYLIDESKSGSFCRPNKVTEIVNFKSGATLSKVDKNLGLGTCIGVLNSTKTIMFSKHGESCVKFCKLSSSGMDTMSKYNPKFNIKKCYELDESKVIATFRDIGMFVVYDFRNGQEMYSLCPHQNDIIHMSIREYSNLKVPQVNLKRKLSSLLNLELCDEEQFLRDIPDPEAMKTELSWRNSSKMIISGGRDRNIIISDVVNMRRMGQITLKNCTSDGYKFIGLKNNEEVWVCTNNQYIYVYDLKEVLGVDNNSYSYTIFSIYFSIPLEKYHRGV